MCKTTPPKVVAKTKQQGLVYYLTKPENTFFQYWSPRDDVLSLKLLPGIQRQLLVQNKTTTGIIWKFSKLLFVLFTIYQVSYGTYQNLRYSVGFEDASLAHFFHYGFVTATLDFWRQPHFILTVHSIFGGVFLLCCIAQVSMVEFTLISNSGKNAYIHRSLGIVTVMCSLIASCCAIWLSFRALYGTEIIYLLGTTTWLFFTLMVLIRAMQRQWLSHSRWAIGLQQLGIMFVTTRIFAPILLGLGMTVADSYHWGVWGAGVTALLYFGYIEGSRQRVLTSLLESGSAKKDTTIVKDFTYSTLRFVVARSFFWFFGAFVFGGAPAIYYFPDYFAWADLSTILAAQAVFLIGFYVIYFVNSVTDPNTPFY
jgi:hypothetical protein